MKPVLIGPPRWVALVALGLTVACTSPSSSATAPPSSPSGSAAALASGGPTATPKPACSNQPGGGFCINTVAAGTYITQLFTPQLTYTTPVDGWQNYEDTSGNFLLVSPGNDLAGVDAGTSEYIGAYTSIGAANRDCATEVDADHEQFGIATTPEALTAEFAARPGLVSTDPQPATVGGLGGLVVDYRMADGYAGLCFYSSAPAIPLIRGHYPSDLDHPVIAGLVMRIYFLARGEETLGVEIDDLSDGANLDGYSAIVGDFQFGN